jgi:hypothetical protein
MTGFIANEFLSRNRVSLKEAFEGLELCERKLSCTVLRLRGLDGSNPVRLLGKSGPRRRDSRVLFVLSERKLGAESSGPRFCISSDNFPQKFSIIQALFAVVYSRNARW